MSAAGVKRWWTASVSTSPVCSGPRLHEHGEIEREPVDDRAHGRRDAFVAAAGLGHAREQAEHVLVAPELADLAERVEMHEPPVLHREPHVQIDRIRCAVGARLLRAHLHAAFAAELQVQFRALIGRQRRIEALDARAEHLRAAEAGALRERRVDFENAARLRIDDRKLVEAAVECELVAIAAGCRRGRCARGLRAHRRQHRVDARHRLAGMHRAGDPFDDAGRHAIPMRLIACAIPGKNAEDRHRRAGMVLAQLAAERERAARIVEELEQHEIDLRILLEERARLCDVLGGVDRVELLRIERIEQHAAIVAIGRDDEDRAAAFAGVHDTHRPSRSRGGTRTSLSGLRRCSEPSISSGTARLAPTKTILRSLPVWMREMRRSSTVSGGFR